MWIDFYKAFRFSEMLFLYYRKLRKTNLAVLRKKKISRENPADFLYEERNMKGGKIKFCFWNLLPKLFS